MPAGTTGMREKKHSWKVKKRILPDDATQLLPLLNRAKNGAVVYFPSRIQRAHKPLLPTRSLRHDKRLATNIAVVVDRIDWNRKKELRQVLRTTGKSHQKSRHWKTCKTNKRLTNMSSIIMSSRPSPQVDLRGNGPLATTSILCCLFWRRAL